MSTLADWQAQARLARHRGQAVAYWQGGNWSDSTLPALLLIHGFPTASWDWHRLWPSLCRRFRVLAVDLLGFGFSAKPRRYDYSITDQADVLQTVATTLAVPRWHLLAHDYGDTVAQELLARDQERAAGALALDSVCLLNGGLFPETHRATPVQKLLHSPLGPVVGRLMNEARFKRSFARVFGAHTQPSADELQDYWALVAAGEGGAGIAHLLIRYIGERRRQRARWVGALSQAPCPVRLICGASDPVSGAHMARRYQALIPNPDVVLLPEIGHYPQCEAPDQVLAAFAAFQDGLDRGRR